MLHLVLCICALVMFARDVHCAAGGGFAAELAAVTARCCAGGERCATNHTAAECSVCSIPRVTPAFAELCLLAADQCCRDYHTKKQDCDTGIDVATSRKDKDCSTLSNLAKGCCTECARGLGEGCPPSPRPRPQPADASAEELLTADALTRCCRKATDNGEKYESSFDDEIFASKKNSTAASVCEEYAPNELCAHHCIPVPGSYRCVCNPGFKLMPDGRNCIEVTRNRCLPRNTCQQRCSDDGERVTCSCRRGYHLQPDGKSCRDIDECSLRPAVCLSDADCRNLQGSYKCVPRGSSPSAAVCPTGFTRNLLNGACDDIDECASSTPPCPAPLCENTAGGYRCGVMAGDPAAAAPERCPPGFTDDHSGECVDVDECALGTATCSAATQRCVNTRGAYVCQERAATRCPPGYRLDTHTRTCEGCLNTVGRIPSINPYPSTAGHRPSQYFATSGSSPSSSSSRYPPRPSSHRSSGHDIDECLEAVCGPDERCINAPGEYTCRPTHTYTRSRSQLDCPDGFIRKSESSTCEDVDECAEGTHLCDAHQECVNTRGSHECRCRSGFELDPTVGACVDVNECATEQHTCIQESQRCDNTVGSFVCIRFVSCGTGYVLHHLSSKCEDIDECALGTHNCDRAGVGYRCVNLPGTFRCVRHQNHSSTTTTTTAAPEYEYYYDSDEETDNSTDLEMIANKLSDPITTTTTTTTSTTTTTAFPLTEPPRAPPQTESGPEDALPDIDERTNEIQPTEQTYTFFTPKEESNELGPTYSLPESNHNDPKTDSREQSKDPARDEDDDQLESNNEVSETVKPKHGDATSAKPEDTYYDPRISEPHTPSSESPHGPQLVFVNVERATATARARKAEDGAVVIDASDLPDNVWTRVDEKPTDCQPGFELDKYGACFDIDECTRGLHSCSFLTEACRNTMGGYLCDCASGFTRDPVSRACHLTPDSNPIPTTSTTTSTPAPASSTVAYSTPKTFWGYRDYSRFTPRPFRPRARCDIGYQYDDNTQRCEDMDECTLGLARCAAAEECINTAGGYRCECAAGWRLDSARHRCVPADERGFPTGYGNNVPSAEFPPVEPESEDAGAGAGLAPPDTVARGDGGASECPRGYRLDDDRTCQDIDECAEGVAKCGATQTCRNLAGGYTCACAPGHDLVADHECADVDECALAPPQTLCSENAECVNTVGSYRCRCHDGFANAPNNHKVCVDVDECVAGGGGLCEQRCNNVWGGYRCSCHRGYTLNPDNRTCGDVDECAGAAGPRVCVGRCVNMPGSYRCACPPGYRLAEDNKSCIDIDECETGVAACTGASAGAGDVCVNVRGSHRCHRIVCPPHYSLHGKHHCKRTGGACAAGDYECAHQPTMYSYHFITFVSHLYIPNGKVELFTMRGPGYADAVTRFTLALRSVDAPPSVPSAQRLTIHDFLLSQSNNQAVVSLTRGPAGPQSAELELTMELYVGNSFGGTAVARLHIQVAEYEF